MKTEQKIRPDQTTSPDLSDFFNEIGLPEDTIGADPFFQPQDKSFEVSWNTQMGVKNVSDP